MRFEIVTARTDIPIQEKPTQKTEHSIHHEIGRTWRRLALPLLLAGLTLLMPIAALARVGGGQGYGGGGGSGGDGDGAGAVIYLLFQIIRILIYLTIEYPIIGVPLDIIVIAGVIYFFVRRGRGGSQSFTATSETVTIGLDGGPVRKSLRAQFDQLRKFDPNFSEIVFTDFCYALYAKVHEARGKGPKELDHLSPYLGDGARGALLQLNPAALREVKGVIIGSMAIEHIRGLETPVVKIWLMFESNYTEVTTANAKAVEMTYYLRERWELERKRDVLSPPPAQATALHCPRCGSPFEKDTRGACKFCGTIIENGEFQWYVRAISLLHREAKGPLLTSSVPEVGTELRSVVQPNFEGIRVAFEQNNPTFRWGEFQARARLIFDELQAAWSTLDWERARPHETDNLFQMHQYWIDAYKRQQLRNVLDKSVLTAMQPVKISEDKFYNSITLRMGASGYDYTIDSSGRVISGSKTNQRHWTEYWTFIRNRNAQPAGARADLNCPNCGAPLKVNSAGVCQFCGGKITSGEFDWVLSKIEQDESYGG